MTPRAYKLAAAALMLSPMSTWAQTGKAFTLPPDLSPRATAAAFNEYVGSLERLLSRARLNDERASSQILRDKAQGLDEAMTDDVATLKIEQQNVERQVDSTSAPFNVSDKASALFDAASQAASDAASDYVNLAADFDIGARMGDMPGLDEDARDTTVALQRDLAAFRKAVTAGHRLLAVR